LSLSTIVAIIYLICGISLFSLAIIILRDNPKAKINKVTSLMLFFAGSGPSLAALGTIAKTISLQITQSVFYNNIFYFWELFFPQLLLFSLIFPEENRYLKKYPKLGWLIFLPHLFHILLMLVFYNRIGLFGSWEAAKTGSLFGWLLEPLAFAWRIVSPIMGALYDFHLQFFSMVNLIYLFLAILFLYQGYKMVKIPSLKRQVKVVLWGIRSSMGLYAIAFILPVLTPLKIPGYLRYFLTVLALLIGSGSIAWAIIKHRFLDVRLIVRQSLVYSATSAILVGLYFLVVGQFSKIIQNALGKPTPILEISYVILALVFFQPIMGQLDDLLKKMFIKESSDYRNMMETFSREIITIFDFNELKETVFDTLKKNMLTENVFLCVGDEGKEKFSLYWDGQKFSCDREDKFLRSLRNKQKTVFLDDLDLKKTDSPLTEFLFPLGIFLLVPLCQKEELVGFIGLSQKITRFRYTYEDLTLLNVLANQLVVAMNNARLYKESLEKQRLEEELLVAKQIQLALLPKAFPHGDSFEFSAYTQPARQVGGDYYDFMKIEEMLIGLAIGDASGKGMPAALLVSLIQASLRAEVKNRLSVSQVISNINQFIFSSTSPERFATMFYGELDPKERKLSYCNAGHNYPILLRENGEVEFLDIGGMILGAFSDAVYQKGEVFLDPLDLTLFYSDGLTEAFNDKEEQFGEERLLDLIKKHRSLPPEKIKDVLISECLEFSKGAPLWDDLTIVVLKVY
jgi:serine phosphatase RsbU (regulator of sigma subunit)